MRGAITEARNASGAFDRKPFTKTQAAASVAAFAPGRHSLNADRVRGPAACSRSERHFFEQASRSSSLANNDEGPQASVTDCKRVASRNGSQFSKDARTASRTTEGVLSATPPKIHSSGNLFFTFCKALRTSAESRRVTASSTLARASSQLCKRCDRLCSRSHWSRSCRRSKSKPPLRDLSASSLRCASRNALSSPLSRAARSSRNRAASLSGRVTK